MWQIFRLIDHRYRLLPKAYVVRCAFIVFENARTRMTQKMESWLDGVRIATASQLVRKLYLFEGRGSLSEPLPDRRGPG